MKKQFEDETGVIIHETNDNIFIPRNNDLIKLKGEMFRVIYIYIDYDENIIEIDIERE